MNNPFTEGVRVQMLINRGVGNSNKGSKRWVNKLISTDTESFNKNVAKLKAQQEWLGDPQIRLYACINDRKIDSAIRLLRHKMIDVPDSDFIGFYTHIQDRLVSCLMQTECRNSKYFLLDIDAKSPIPSCWAMAHIPRPNNLEVVHKYETPNGFHYIINPMDVRLLKDIPDCTLQKDGLMLIHTLKGV